MANRPRYSGSLYQRGGVWQMQWFVEGRRCRESAKTGSKDEAAKLLNIRLGEARENARRVKPITVTALADLYLSGQKARWKPQTYKWTKIICDRHIVPAFGPRNPASILPGDLDKFVSQKKDEKLSESRINRLLVIFRAVLRYGVRNKVLREVPEFPKPFNEAIYVRTGHIEDVDFVFNLRPAIEDTPWLFALVLAAYQFGFRLNELLYMRVNQIDLLRHIITLPAGSTKNRMPRRTVMNPKATLHKLLEGLVKNKRPDQYLFSRDGGSTPVRDFRHVWGNAVAGITTGSGKGGKLLFHDLRRSAITRMASAGLSEVESMAVAGHLSPAVHRRYKQISEGTAREIAARIDIE
jgi:integrase